MDISKIILIGPMGAGKSTVGRELASKLQSDFQDTDLLIENAEGRSISEIFVEAGEPYFRKIEAEIVKGAIKDLDLAGGVLALGGGAVINEATQVALRESSAKKVFLDISLSAVAPRVGFDSARPLLIVNPRQKWNELMTARRPIYEELSDIVIDVSELSVAEVVARITATVGVA